MIEIKKGNIFTTHCQTIVNTVNCVGVMGAGIAYEFRLRYPEMYMKYKKICENGLFNIGNLWLYKSQDRWILNFPTKQHWKYPSKIEYLEKALQKFIDTYKEKGIESIAFPLLGASKGGISEEESLAIMKKYLNNCDIKIEIWYYNPNANDELFEEFKQIFLKLDNNIISLESKIGIKYIKLIKEALLSDSVNSLNGLLNIKGIGEKTLEKSFLYVSHYKERRSLFS